MISLKQMDESKSKAEKRQKERRFDQELLKEGLRCDQDQYEILKRCSDAKDMTKWNEWRNENLGVDIFLEGAYLDTCHLKGIHLESRGIKSLNEEETIDTSRKLHSIVYLKGAHFTFADLQQAKFMLAVLSDTEFGGAKLQGANFTKAILHKANLENAELEGADFCYTQLQGANFETAIVHGSTLIWKPKVDRYRKGKRFTDFSGVALDAARIDPGTKQLLEYNIRRMNWERWYEKRRFWHYLIRVFWQISDYGINAPRIIRVFFVLSMLFAVVYYVLGAVDCYIFNIKDHPGIVSNLFVDSQGTVMYWWLVPLRSIYFSIVTMTTLGFGDMYANAENYWWGWLGHLLLIIQVCLGYVLLGALITRFAVLFTAGGPAGTFSEEKKT